MIKYGRFVGTQTTELKINLTKLKLISMIFISILSITNRGYGQCIPCLTNHLVLNTGYNHEAGNYYSVGTSDEYWRITSAPAAYSTPICAKSLGEYVSGWWAFGATTCRISITGSGIADGNTECNDNCNYDDAPYRFERSFCVNTGLGNPTVNGTLNIDKYCGDLKIKAISLIGPGGTVLSATGICYAQVNCPHPSINMPIGFTSGIYTLKFDVANDWSCSGWPFVTKTSTPMNFELTGSVDALPSIFTDNNHFGKNTTLCAPSYPPSPEFALNGANCIPLASTATYSITPFYNASGQNTYTITGPGSPAISTSGTFNVGAGTYTITSTDAKGCSQSKVIDINNNPSLTLTPSFQCIASGSTSNITASATGTSPFVYSLNGGAYTSNNVFNLSQGVYSVTVKDAKGCTGSATAKIGNVFSAYLESKFNSSTTCDPDILVASTWPAITPIYYSFNGSTPSTTNTFATTGAGTYTVIATDAYGCTASSTIIVHPHPLVSATAAPCVAGPPASITITANASGPTAPYSYQLNTGTWQSSNIFVVPNSGTYTVTVSNVYGCTAMTTITTPPMLVSCCNPAAIATTGAVYFNGWSTPINVTTSLPTLPLIGPGVYGFNNVTTNIIFDGIVNVNAGSTLYFNGCPNILMGPNAEIVMQNGSTLIIENSILRAACNIKWKGITATNGTQTVRLSKPSEFHDMWNGVEIIGSATNAALLQCEGVSFIDDDFGIVLRNTQSGYSGYVWSSLFKSTSAMLGPTQRTKRGVSIYNCNEVEIGGLYTGTTILGNKFENLDNGIYVSANVPTTSAVLNSSIRLYNNFFAGISGGKQVNDAIQTPANNIYNSDLGCAVYAKNFTSYYPQANIRLTIDNLDYKAYTIPTQQFLNCDKGVITSNVSLDLSHTMMYNTKAGCLNTFTDGRQFNIRNNYFSETMKAISVVGFNLNIGKISDNRIEISGLQPLISGGTGTFYTPIGISLQRVVTSTITSATSYFHINANRIWIRGEGGIGVDLLSGANDKVFDNVIEHKNTNTGGVTYTMVPEFIAIQLTNSDFCDVKFNSIIGNNVTRNYYGSNSAIRLNKSKYVDLYCNDIKNTKYGFLVTSDCGTNSSSVIGNNFDNHIFAMLFLFNGSEGTLGSSIGSPASASIPGLDPDNKFGSTSYPLGYRLFKSTVCSTGTSEKYFTSPFILTNAQSGGTSFNCRYTILNNGTPTNKPNCNVLPHFKIANALAIDSLQDLVAVATGSVIYPEFEEGARWMDEQNLYKLLSIDTVLRYSHPALDSFYNVRENTDNEYIRLTDDEMGLMMDSLSMLDSTLFNHHLKNARSGNASIVTIDQEAINVQMINDVYFTIIEQGIDAINISDDSLIQAFAFSCPFVTGIAAYKARALYGMYNPAITYNDLEICNGVGAYKGENNHGRQLDFLYDLNSNTTNEESGNDEIKIYPNPASDNLTISYNLQKGQNGVLVLYDMIGREQERIYLSDGANKVQVSIMNLQTGVYAYKYLVDGDIHGAGKLIIK
jgi:hypothetical protein